MGARWYDYETGRFTQPDSIIPNLYNPQSLNRYSYVLNNPVKYTDPTGHRPCSDSDENGNCVPEEPSLPPVPTIPDSPPEGDPADPWEVGVEWLTGQGPRQHQFRRGDQFAELLLTHSHIQAVRELIAARVKMRNYRPSEESYSVAGLDGVLKYLGDYSNVLTLGHTGNLAVTYLGSYGLEYHVANVNKQAGATEVVFHVWNESNLASATHPPVLGYTQFWRENIEPAVMAASKTGPMSPVTQDFWWKETIKFK
jgi:hypothetical protein